MLKNTQKNQSGMTLIEMLISIAMIGGLIVLYSASFNVIGLTKTMKSENIAYHIANIKIEELRTTTYASLPPSGSFTDPQLSQLPSGTAAFTVTNYGSYTGLKEFVVTVSWNDGRARSVQLKTLAGTGGINP